MSDLKVHLSLQPSQVTPETGIGRAVLAQHKYLPEHGIQLVTDAHQADVIACHVGRDERLPQVSVLHIHGLYFQDLPHEPYKNWHQAVNRGIIQSMREASVVTVPSEWVGMPLRRDMRIRPRVIGHGVDLNEWKPGENLHYILWGKNRASDVCDPTPAWEMARRGLPVIATFAPAGKPEDPNLTITGLLPASQMRTVVASSDVYLATTIETFGIGTLEALACGVPVLGYAWGGTQDIVRHKIDGYLVEPGNIEGLVEGYTWIRAHRDELSANARQRAAEFSWSNIIRQYADLYREVAGEVHFPGVAVVVPCFRYGKYLEECVKSIQNQTLPVVDIIIVDDCSPDDTQAVATRLIESDNRIRYIRHETNQGVAAARNHGIEATLRDLIICLDADDRLEPRYVEVCAGAMEADKSLGVAYTNMTMQGEGGQPVFSNWPEFDFELMASVGNPPPTCIPSASMFRRDMWARAGGYRQVYAPAEDTEFWVRGLSTGFNARKVSNDSLWWYRVHDGSASRTLTYRPIDAYHPWMRDKQYPLAVPGVKKPVVRSYARSLVSVVIPVGPGHARYLPAALDSLLGQTLREWEVIVVNDTGEDLGAVLTPYPFANVYLNKGLRGAGGARNTGIAQATAPLLLLLDADDYLDPTALERMVEVFMGAGGRYVYTDWIAMEDGVEPKALQTPEYNPYRWFEALIGRSSGVHGVTVLMATADAKANHFDEELPGWEEVEWFIRLATLGIEGTRLAAPLFYYRVSTGARRRQSLQARDELGSEILSRFMQYVKGEKIMPGCCGGSGGDALLAAKRMMAGMETEPVEQAAASMVTRMEFIGLETGPVYYRGVENSGRQYRGAATSECRFANVDPADVENLERSGKWKRVQRAVAMHQPAPTAAPAPIVARSEADLRKDAEAALLAARQAFAEPDPMSEEGFFAAAAETPEPVGAVAQKTAKKTRRVVKYD